MEGNESGEEESGDAMGAGLEGVGAAPQPAPPGGALQSPPQPLTVEESAQARAELEAIISREGLHLHTAPGLLPSMYQVGSAIGKGKFATVYRATRLSDGALVAVKEIALFDVADARSREKCLKELRLIQGLEHPHIIRFLDGFVEGRHLVLVFEFAEAGDLKRQLRKAREKGVRFEERIVWRYFAQLAEAVAHLHSRRIIHRDLKPANIFLTLAGTVKVGDLGLGRLLSQDTLVAHSKVGTPLYMAPECLKGGGHDYAADVWSLGCILYELAMATSPFKEEGLNLYGLFQKITSGVYPPVAETFSPQLRALVGSMLLQDPAARPDIAKVVAVASEMRAALGGRAKSAGPGSQAAAAAAAAAAGAAAAAAAAAGAVAATPAVEGGEGTSATAAQRPVPRPASARRPTSAATPRSVVAVPGDAAHGGGGGGGVGTPLSSEAGRSHAATFSTSSSSSSAAAAAAAAAASAASSASAATASELPPASSAPGSPSGALAAPPHTDAELAALCRDLPLAACSWLQDRLRQLGFFAALAPPPPPATPQLLRAHAEAAIPRALMSRVLFAAPPASGRAGGSSSSSSSSAAPGPGPAHALGEATAGSINRELQFVCLVGLLRWLSANLASCAGGSASPSPSSNRSPAAPAAAAAAAAALAGAMEEAVRLTGTQSPLAVAGACLLPALAAFSPALAAHCAAHGPSALAAAWGEGALFPLLYLVEAAARARQVRLQGPSAQQLGEREREREGQEVVVEEEEGGEQQQGGRALAEEIEEEGRELAAPLFTGAGSAGRSLQPPACLAWTAAVAEQWQREVGRFAASAAAASSSSGSGSARAGKRQAGHWPHGSVHAAPTLLGNWRERMQLLSSARAQLAGAAAAGGGGSLLAGVGALSQGLREQLQRIEAQEAQLNSSGSGSGPLPGTLPAAAAACRAAAARVGAAQGSVGSARAAVAEASAALCSLEERLEGEAEVCAAAAAALSSDSRLGQLRAAVLALHRDNLALDVQLGVVVSAVSGSALREHERARERARSAAAGGGSRR